MKKYELTSEYIEVFGRKLFRIKALIAFGSIEVGELGGYVETENNLSQSGNAWVYGDARVSGNARVSDNARVYGDAWVSGNAMVYGDARVSDNARVYGDARVYDNAWVYGDARVSDNAMVYGDARVSDNAWVYGDADITKETHLITIGAIGSRNDFTTFFRSKTKEILVRCGCFRGNIKEFETAVLDEHKGTKHEKTYKIAIALAKVQIEMEG